MKRIKLSKWAKENGYTYTGAYQLLKRGDFPDKYVQLPSGTILIEVDSNVKNNFRTAIYTRVSSSQNRKNLDGQAERLKVFCCSNGWVVDLEVKECASGLNDTRPKLLSLLSDPTIGRIVVEHKDRLTRFGFNYIETLFAGEIVVANRTHDEKEIVEDLVSIITSFCARIYGKRRSKRKTEKIVDELRND